MPFYVLSLDIGRNMGWALLCDNEIVYSGEKYFPKPLIEGRDLLAFGEWLNQFSGINEIYIEDISFVQNPKRPTTSGAAREVYHGFKAVIKMFCGSTGVKKTEISPGEWKKVLTGHGRVKKEHPKDDIEKRRICAKLHSIGWKGGKVGTTLCNNEADAIGILIAIRKQLGHDVTIRRE